MRLALTAFFASLALALTPLAGFASASAQQASAKLGFPLEKPLKRPELPGIAGQWRGPSQFFNGKIAPVVPYAIRGSIWCQGESNSDDGRLYAARWSSVVV